MYARPTIFPGVLAATLLAGPVGTLLLAAGAISVRAPGPEDAGILAVVLVFSIPVGMVVSFIPNLVGAAVLARLGSSNDGMRLPQVWFTVGALAGGAIGTLVRDGASDAGPVLWFGAVGATCAILCRRGVRWD